MNYTDYYYPTETGTYYAKPSTALASGTWASGVVSYSRIGSLLAYSATLDSETHYTIFKQSGGSPASTDEIKAFAPENYSVDIKERTDLITEANVNVAASSSNPDDIDPHVTGDTFMGKTFSVTDQNGDAVNLTGATITMQFRNGKRLIATMTIGDGLSVVSASGGTFKIDEQVIDWDAPMVVSFDAEVVTSGGDTITAASGRWPILADVTVPS